MRYFELDNAISQDECHDSLKNEGNSTMYEYNVDTVKTTGDHCQSKFFTDNPNLRCKDGFGYASQENIDCDSKLRYKDPHEIRGPDKQQLYSRTFTAVPDLSTGTFLSDVESNLIHSHDTYVDKGCESLTETYYDRNQLYNPCVNDHYVKGYEKSVEGDIRTGIPSRDMKQCPKYNIPDMQKQFQRVARNGKMMTEEDCRLCK